jgi:hypothetical protein
MGILAKARKQSPQTRGVLRGKGIYFHAKAATIGGHVTYLCLGTNLSLLHEEVKAHQLAFLLARSSFQKQSRGT